MEIKAIEDKISFLQHCRLSVSVLLGPRGEVKKWRDKWKSISYVVDIFSCS